MVFSGRIVDWGYFSLLGGTMNKLEDKCMNCDGKKQFEYQQRGEPVKIFKCEACNGTGLIPSYDGNQLIKFVQKYFGGPTNDK
jgi:Tryptophan RNA-binding attenuator protein inhibitory protein